MENRGGSGKLQQLEQAIKNVEQLSGATTKEDLIIKEIRQGLISRFVMEGRPAALIKDYFRFKYGYRKNEKGAAAAAAWRKKEIDQRWDRFVSNYLERLPDLEPAELLQKIRADLQRLQDQQRII